MPELPEVETIARSLREGGRGSEAILGATITKVNVLWKKSIACPGVPEFERRVAGATIRSINRRGKYISIGLSCGWLFVHLRMSGDLTAVNAVRILNAHDRVTFDLSSQQVLVFNDTRKFGRIWFTEDPALVCSHLGLEPFDEALTGDSLYDLLKSRKKRIKTLLLDQSFLAGIGNIYADEALFIAGIHPLTQADHVTPLLAEILLKSIRQVLQLGIDRNGASIDWVYRGGQFQNDFNVYQRGGDPCRSCATPIERIMVGQRGTHFCPKCQILF